jgi:hypothetical protein
MIFLQGIGNQYKLKKIERLFLVNQIEMIDELKKIFVKFDNSNIL